MARTKQAATPIPMATPAPVKTSPAGSPAPDATPAPEASPADRAVTDTSAPPKVLHPPKKAAPAAKKSLSFQDFINEANSSGDDDADANPRARKLRRKALLESMPVMNLSSQAFSPTAEERPKTPPTPGAAGATDADAMEVDGKAPADLAGVPPADLAGLPPFDIFGDSDDEGPATWGGGCLSPRTCAKEHNTNPTHDPTHDPTHAKEPCRLMPKNYKQKPPMHSGSVYNATELVRRKSTSVARTPCPPATVSAPDQNAPEIENLQSPASKETPLPSFLKRTCSGLSDDEDVDTNSAFCNLHFQFTHVFQ